MSTYFVSAGGSSTSPYDTWAKAANSLAAALALATANDDTVVIQYDAVPSADAELVSDTTYVLAGNICIVSASNNGGSSWSPAPMLGASWIGNSTTNCAVRFSGAFRALFDGLTLRVSGGANDNIEVPQSGDGYHYELHNCRFWLASTSASSNVIIGAVAGNANGYVRLVNPTFVFGHASQKIQASCTVDVEGGGVLGSGLSPATLIFPSNNCTGVKFSGTDLSQITGAIVGNNASNAAAVVLDRCKLGAGVAWLTTQSVLNKSGSSVTVIDCASGDTHGVFGYQDALGLLTTDAGVYVTASPAGASWKVVTTANASRHTPFVTPWVSTYWGATSEITPRIEVLRNGSSTAYTDSEVWGEFLVKVTSGSTLGTYHADRAALSAAGTAQAAGVGLGSWTGESGTAWSGKVDSGAPLTPAEAGDLSARVFVGAPSATVFVDPMIRTA
jgi:hypothetical protein